MQECLRAFDGHHINFSQNATDSQNGVLFLHGVTRNWRSFYPLLGELNSECKLTAIDFRGHGHSGRTSGSYLVTDYVEDVLAVLESSFVPQLPREEPAGLREYSCCFGGWSGSGRLPGLH